MGVWQFVDMSIILFGCLHSDLKFGLSIWGGSLVVDNYWRNGSLMKHNEKIMVVNN